MSTNQTKTNACPCPPCRFTSSLPFSSLPASLAVVTTEEGQSLANDFGIQFFETSAKTDINVEKAFVTIAREVRALLLLMMRL